MENKCSVVQNCQTFSLIRYVYRLPPPRLGSINSIHMYSSLDVYNVTCNIHKCMCVVVRVYICTCRLYRKFYIICKVKLKKFCRYTVLWKAKVSGREVCQELKDERKGTIRPKTSLFHCTSTRLSRHFFRPLLYIYAKKMIGGRVSFKKYRYVAKALVVQSTCTSFIHYSVMIKSSSV